jgi:hypothetical protein
MCASTAGMLLHCCMLAWHWTALCWHVRTVHCSLQMHCITHRRHTYSHALATPTSDINLYGVRVSVMGSLAGANWTDWGAFFFGEDRSARFTSLEFVLSDDRLLLVGFSGQRALVWDAYTGARVTDRFRTRIREFGPDVNSISLGARPPVLISTACRGSWNEMESRVRDVRSAEVVGAWRNDMGPLSGAPDQPCIVLPVTVRSLCCCVLILNYWYT